MSDDRRAAKIGMFFVGLVVALVLLAWSYAGMLLLRHWVAQ